MRDVGAKFQDSRNAGRRYLRRRSGDTQNQYIFGNLVLLTAFLALVFSTGYAILYRELYFCRLFKKFVKVVNSEITYSTVRFAALQDAVEEAEIMRTVLGNYTFVGFSKSLCKSYISK